MSKREHTNILSNYTPLQYIEGTGTQWIDLGITPTNDMSVEIDYIVKINTSYTYSGLIFSGNNYNTNDNFGIAVYNSYRTVRGYRAGVGNIVPVAGYYNIKDNDDVTIRLTNTGQFTLINRTTSNTYTNTFTINTLTNATRTIYVLKGNTNNADIAHIAKGKIKKVLLTTTTDTYTFLPYMRNGDNKIGLLCYETGDFCTNAGIGEFLYA